MRLEVYILNKKSPLESCLRGLISHNYYPFFKKAEDVDFLLFLFSYLFLQCFV